MKTVIEMAREAGFMKTVQGGAEVSMASMDCLERFAELVRADERNRVWTQEDWTEYEYSIAAVENEACAKVCDELHPGLSTKRAAEHIRARMKR